MTKYYVMEVDDESAAEYPDKYNWDSPTSGSALRQYIQAHKSFPTFIPTLEQEIYDDQEFNKLNDFIHGPIEKYCVSKRIKNVLQEFKLPEYKFYPVSVYRPNKIFFGLIKTSSKIEEEYFAFHYDCFNISNTDKFIDFDKTLLTKDYLGLEQTDEIFLNSTFDHSLDLFELNFSWMTYVSEKLMNKLIEIKATGLIFSEIGERQYKVKRPNPKLTWL